MFMVLNLTITYAYGEDGQVRTEEQQLCQVIEEIEREVRESFKGSKEFRMMVKEYGQQAGEELIDEIVSGRVEIYLNDTYKVKINSFYNYSVSVPVPVKAQINSYYCGPATVLQTLYGLQTAGSLSSPMPSGSDTQKQQTLGSNMGTNTSGTYVYRVRNELNKYVRSSKYVYALGSMSFSTFANVVENSLRKNRPVVLHARTEYLPYYNGRASGHYISLDTYSETNMIQPYSIKGISSSYIHRTARLVDCNFNSTYRGFFTVPFTAVHNAVRYHSRYVIYGAN